MHEILRSLNVRSLAQRGIAGLETAIIMVAFVGVATIFAFTVVNAGVFSSQKAKISFGAAIEQSQSTLIVTGEVTATAVTSLQIDSADEVWDPRTNVSAVAIGADLKEGYGSNYISIASSFTTGQIAHSHLSSTLTFSSRYTIGLWIKPSTSVTSGLLRLVLYSNSDGNCSSTVDTLLMPALTANTWQQVYVKLASPSSSHSVACIGLTTVSDPGVLSFYIDDVRLPAEVQRLKIPIANTGSGYPVDIMTTIDSDSDGLLSDEQPVGHPLLISYLDKGQVLEDLAWSITTPGKNNGDTLLQPGEKALLTIELSALSPLPGDYTASTIFIKPTGIAQLTIKRTIPRISDALMVLQDG